MDCKLHAACRKQWKKLRRWKPLLAGFMLLLASSTIAPATRNLFSNVMHALSNYSAHADTKPQK